MYRAPLKEGQNNFRETCLGRTTARERGEKISGKKRYGWNRIFLFV